MQGALATCYFRCAIMFGSGILTSLLFLIIIIPFSRILHCIRRHACVFAFVPHLHLRGIYTPWGHLTHVYYSTARILVPYF